MKLKHYPNLPSIVEAYRARYTVVVASGGKLMPQDSIAGADTGLNLIRLGAALFLAGLLTGLAVSALANPRMGLSAHLEGVMNGTFLIALGAAWPHVRLSPLLDRCAFGLLAFGSIANWLVTLLSALWHTGALTPIAAPAPRAAPWQEVVVQTGLMALSVAMIGGVALVLCGLLARRDR